MPRPILSSQAPVTARPQTSRAAKRAFSKRRETGPSKKDLERFAREDSAKRAAEDKKRKEKKKKENERKRDEERQKLKEKIKEFGVEHATKVEEGQTRIAGFFKTRTKVRTHTEELKDTSFGKLSGSQTAALGKKLENFDKPVSRGPRSYESLTTKAETLIGDSTQAAQTRMDVINAQAERVRATQGSNNDRAHFDMPPPKRPEHRAILSVPDVKCSTESPIHTKGATGQKLLDALSPNLHPPQQVLPALKKRKAPSPELDENWANFFQSNTQIERELCVPAESRQHKRPRVIEPLKPRPNTNTDPIRRSRTEVYVKSVSKTAYTRTTTIAVGLESPRSPLHTDSTPNVTEKNKNNGGEQEVKTSDGATSADTMAESILVQPVVEVNQQPPHKPATTAQTAEQTQKSPLSTKPHQEEVKRAQEGSLETCDDFFDGLSSQELANIPTSPFRDSSPNASRRKPGPELGRQQQQRGEELERPRISKERQLSISNSSFDGFDWAFSSQELVGLVP